MREIIKYTYQISTVDTATGCARCIYAVGAGKAKYIAVGSYPYAGSPELLRDTYRANRVSDALAAMLKQRLFYIRAPV